MSTNVWARDGGKSMTQQDRPWLRTSLPSATPADCSYQITDGCAVQCHIGYINTVQLNIVVVSAHLQSLLGFRLEEGILSGRHHALPTPKVPSVLTFTFKDVQPWVCCELYGYGYFIREEQPLPLCWGSVFREPQVGREPPVWFSF